MGELRGSWCSPREHGLRGTRDEWPRSGVEAGPFGESRGAGDPEEKLVGAPRTSSALAALAAAGTLARRQKGGPSRPGVSRDRGVARRRRSRA